MKCKLELLVIVLEYLFSFAGSRLEMLLKRFPMLVKDCIPKLTDAIQEEAPTEDAALGACNVLVRSPVMRYLMQV